MQNFHFHSLLIHSPVFFHFGVQETGNHLFLQPGAINHSADSSWSAATGGRSTRLGRVLKRSSCPQSKILKGEKWNYSKWRQSGIILITEAITDFLFITLNKQKCCFWLRNLSVRKLWVQIKWRFCLLCSWISTIIAVVKYKIARFDSLFCVNVMFFY